MERNPLTAKLVTDPLGWKYGSLYRRYKGISEEKGLLVDWPVEEPSDYLQQVAAPLTSREFEKLSPSKEKGVPFGDDGFVLDRVEKYNLGSTLRGRGRPKQI